jgi:anthranilate phosphoribosyltransferase
MSPPDTQNAFDPLLAPIQRGEELTSPQCSQAVAALTDEHAADAAKATFLRALHRKGETPGEIAAFAQALLGRALDPEIDLTRLPGPTIDVCGTGGDKLDLFNVSTTACFVLAAAGATVIKHGNRAVTSRSGGSDVLTALGIPLDLPAAALRRQLEECSIGFLAAPRYHPAFRAVAGVRQLLAAEGTRTIFNLLGPLLNPARPEHQLVGVFAPALTGTFAEVLRRMGRRRVWAVHGAGGMDELSTLGETRVSRSDEASGAVTHTDVRPEDAGLARVAHLADLRGGTPAENARTLVGILEGETIGPRRDLVLLNAAAGFVVTGLETDLEAGRARAEESIDSGRARRLLARIAGG